MISQIWLYIPAIAAAFTAGYCASSRRRRRFLLKANALFDPPLQDGTSNPPYGEQAQFTTAHDARVSELVEMLRQTKLESQDLVERYQLLTANLGASVIMRDAKGKITYCSQYTEVLTGYAVSEIYAAEDDFLLQIVHPDDRDNYQRAFRFSALGDAYQFRYRILHKSGIELWVESRMVSILDDAGEVSSSLSITLDVTGPVRYQKLIEEKNKDLHDFTYMVSHDLKAPIFTIKGMANILKEDPAGPDAGEATAHIQKAALSLERLVTGVLEYFRVANQENAPERFELRGVFDELLNDFSGPIQANQVKIELLGEFPALTSDRLKLYQVFSNLLGNAIKYRAPERPCEIRVESSIDRSGRNLLVSVSDNGQGIPADKLEIIFRPFQRISHSGVEGSGIGLACVKKLVERIGGGVDVWSKVGEGSRFTITLRGVIER